MVDLDTSMHTAEAKIGRAMAPASYRPAGLRRWRWDVTVYRKTEGAFPGVYDARRHLHGNCGYTFTWLGALLAMGRVIRRG